MLVSNQFTKSPKKSSRRLPDTRVLSGKPQSCVGGENCDVANDLEGSDINSQSEMWDSHLQEKSIVAKSIIKKIWDLSKVSPSHVIINYYFLTSTSQRSLQIFFLSPFAENANNKHLQTSAIINDL
jgi:hypothetical protein